MKRDRWQQIDSIIDRALSLEGEERTHFVEKHCGNDPALFREVVDLLDSIKASENLWEELFESNRVVLDDLSDTLAGKSGPDLPASISTVGPYRLIHRLGLGGMGEVWQAERADGQFEQQVAVKIVRSGTGLQEHYRRFRQERQILATLNHPNIAGLLDGGLTDDGRPYLVIEYVDGVSITKYCTENNCSLPRRLELFGQVCRAVQYAHRNLVVHRDLKPDNILVTGEGQLKVLDFGIAKLLDAELTDRTLIETRPGLRMMSLSYAAPEQISMEQVTTATDVYALGLLLYELLTGIRPFDLKGKKLAEAEQIIRNQDPPRPSLQAARWHKELKGDLDAIILKALRKEPEQRYESVAQLLEDIDRYGKSLPVMAGSDSFRYRSSKFVKRHRMGITIAAVILLLSAGFGFYHTWQVTQERNIARTEAEKARQTTDFLVQLFESADPHVTEGKEISAKELLEAGTQQIASLDDQPEIQADLLFTIGRAHGNLGYYEEALDILQQSLELQQQQFGSNSLEAANVLYEIGILHKNRRDFENAIFYIHQAAQIRRIQQPEEPVETALMLVNLSEAMTLEGQIDSSKNYMEEGLSILRNNLPPHHEYILRAKTGLAMIYRHEQNYEQAASLLKENIDVMRSEGPSDLTEFIPNLNNLGYVYRLHENYSAAEAAYREAIELGTTVFGEDHPTVLMMMSNLASVLQYQQKLEEAEQLLIRKIRLHKNRFGTFHWRTGASINRLALFYMNTQNHLKAIPFLDETIAIYIETLGPAHTWTATVMGEKSSCLQALGNLAEAESLFKKSFDLIRASSERINYNEKRNIDRLARHFEQVGDSTRADLLREFLKEIGYS